MTGIVGSPNSNSKCMGHGDSILIDGLGYSPAAGSAGGAHVYRHFDGNFNANLVNHYTPAFTPRQQCMVECSWTGHHSFSSGTRYFVLGLRNEDNSTDYEDSNFQTVMGSNTGGTSYDTGAMHTYQTGGWYAMCVVTKFYLQANVSYKIRQYTTGGSTGINGSELHMIFHPTTIID